MENTGKPNKDEDDEKSKPPQFNGEEDDPNRGLTQAEEYRVSICNGLKGIFKSHTDDEIRVIWSETVEELTLKIDKGDFDPRDDARGLLWTIAYRNAIDLLHKKLKRRIAPHVDPDKLPARPFDAIDLPDLLDLIHRFVERRLTKEEQLVLRTWVGLVCGGHATKSGRLPLATLVDEVNRFANPKMTPGQVQSALRTGRRKLRDFLIDREYWDQEFWDLFDSKAPDESEAEAAGELDGETPDESDGGNTQ